MGGRTEMPRALSHEEFEKRIAAGARTFEEIDPEFCKMWRSDMRCNNIMLIIVSVLGAIFVIAFLVGFLGQLAKGIA